LSGCQTLFRALFRVLGVVAMFATGS